MLCTRIRALHIKTACARFAAMMYNICKAVHAHRPFYTVSYRKYELRMNTNQKRPQSASLTQQISDFLQGRNGFDELSILLLEIAVVLFIVSHLLPGLFVFLKFIVLFIVVYVLFRLTSYNIRARRDEAWAVISKLGPYRLFITNPIKAAQEFIQHRYLSCPACHASMRVPRNKGAIRVTCPACGNKFATRS